MDFKKSSTLKPEEQSTNMKEMDIKSAIDGELNGNAKYGGKSKGMK